MGKPSQASDDQLNAWVSSLSGDILATSTTAPIKKTSSKNKNNQHQSEHNAKKRPNDESVQRDHGRKHDRKRGRKHADAAIEQRPVETTIGNVQKDESKVGIDDAAGLRAIEMTIENAIDLSVAKTVAKKKYRAPYDPGKIPVASVSNRKLNLQPRRSDYGGIGLARESIYIPLDVNGWRGKLCKKFREHIPGFFGKQRTKAMKKQTDGDMLWRQRLAIKQQQDQQSQSDEFSDEAWTLNCVRWIRVDDFDFTILPWIGDPPRYCDGFLTQHQTTNILIMNNCGVHAPIHRFEQPLARHSAKRVWSSKQSEPTKTSFACLQSTPRIFAPTRWLATRKLELEQRPPHHNPKWCKTTFVDIPNPRSSERDNNNERHLFLPFRSLKTLPPKEDTVTRRHLTGFFPKIIPELYTRSSSMVKIANHQPHASFATKSSGDMTQGDDKTSTSSRIKAVIDLEAPPSLETSSNHTHSIEDLSHSDSSSSSSLFLLRSASLTAPSGCEKRGRFLVWPVADGGVVRGPPHWATFTQR